MFKKEQNKAIIKSYYSQKKRLILYFSVSHKNKIKTYQFYHKTTPIFADK